MVTAYILGGLVMIQLFLSLFRTPDLEDPIRKRQQMQATHTLPGGRSPSAISHIYQDFEKQQQFEHRMNSHHGGNKSMVQNQVTPTVPLKKEKEIKVYTKKPSEVYTNPVDPKI